MFLSKTVYPLLNIHPHMTETVVDWDVKNQNKLNLYI